MITVKFPPLYKGMMKQKDLTDNDVRRGILVIDHCAILMGEDFILIADLMEYFTSNYIESEDEINKATEILDFMNGKLFSADYWKEISVGSNISVKDGLLHMESPKHSKFIESIPVNFNVSNLVDKIKSSLESLGSSTKGIGVSMSSISKIQSAIGSEINSDNILFEYSNSSYSSFRFRYCDYYYGIVTNRDSEDSIYNPITDFLENSESLMEIYEEEKSKVAPPPPNAVFTNYNPDEL